MHRFFPLACTTFLAIQIATVYMAWHEVTSTSWQLCWGVHGGCGPAASSTRIDSGLEHVGTDLVVALALAATLGVAAFIAGWLGRGSRAMNIILALTVLVIDALIAQRTFLAHLFDRSVTLPAVGGHVFAGFSAYLFAALAVVMPARPQPLRPSIPSKEAMPEPFTAK